MSSATERPRLYGNFLAKFQTQDASAWPPCTDEFVFIGWPSKQHFQRERAVTYKVISRHVSTFRVLLYAYLFLFLFQGHLT